jgi:hypothetical protein
MPDDLERKTTSEFVRNVSNSKDLLDNSLLPSHIDISAYVLAQDFISDKLEQSYFINKRPYSPPLK